METGSIKIKKKRQERERDRQTETERQRQREKETETDRQREREPRDQRLNGPTTVLLGTISSLDDARKRVRLAVDPLSHLSDKACDYFLW